MREGGAIVEMFGQNIATRGPYTELEGEIGAFLVFRRKIFEIPIVCAIGRNFRLTQTFAAYDFANHASLRAPLAGAIFQMTMPGVAARVNSEHERVGSAPFVERVRVKKS